ncbi:NADH-quinone oxidoreductase subunit M [bacterium]|nr:NADH-quinone oxidoreductase subunit M [bacterium]
MNILLSPPILVFLPMIVSLLIISPLFTSNEIVVRRFAKGFCAFHFLYTILMLGFFNPENPYVSELHFFGMDWIQSLGIKFVFKIDAISMILSALTSFVFLISIISSKFNIRKHHKFYYSMQMLLMSAILGIFTSGDMFLFFLFWELEMIPAYFLIGGNFSNVTGNEFEGNPKKSAIKFILFTFTGSMFMLLGILLLHYFNVISSGNITANFSEIFVQGIPMKIQLFIMACLLVGFGVKLPFVPLHTWLPDAHTDASTPVSMVLAGILLKTGGYGLYRFNYQLMPDAFRLIAPILAIFAVISIIYTAFVCYTQTDIKRIIAYSSISNMGLVLLGLCAFNQIGLTASVFHMVAHALVTCGLFMIAGIVYLRYKNRDINTLSGIASKMPRLFGFAVLIVLASIGVPLFAPFVGEILTIIGALNSDFSFILKACAILSLPLLILCSCYMLKFLHNSFYGIKSDISETVNDISIHEFIVLASVLAGLIIFGLYPNALLNIIMGLN